MCLPLGYLSARRCNVILALLIIILLYYQQTILINKSIAGSQSQQSQEQLPISACEEIITKLDHTFDLRRSVRQKSKFKPVKVKHYFDLFEPEAVCFSDERFGFSPRYEAFGDGPKFVCGVDVIAAKGKLNNCLVYSVGSKNKIEFETAVHNVMGCEIHVFDPTVQVFVGGDIATFHPWALGIDGKKAMGKVGKSVETIMKELGHVDRKLDILKIDCEGCEYDVMPILFNQMTIGKIVIDQILIELHTKDFNIINSLFEAADKAGMRISHKERNSWGCEGFKCVEYAFVSESFLRDANKAIMCPT